MKLNAITLSAIMTIERVFNCNLRIFLGLFGHAIFN